MSKRVLVLGSSGMLGSRVIALMARNWEVIFPDRSRFNLMAPSGAIDEHQPDIIVNCAGAIPQKGAAPEMIIANALGPHLVAQAARLQSVPVIHISTDCVFSGIPDPRQPNRRYRVGETAYPRDIYGRSKLLGEVDAPHVTNVRTSFIGPEHGLWAWLASQEDGAEVEGWHDAFWTGSTVWAVAQAIAELAEQPPGGIVHLATQEKVSKFDVLTMLKEHLGLSVAINLVHKPQIDRALAPTMTLPSLAEALKMPDPAAQAVRA